MFLTPFNLKSNESWLKVIFLCSSAAWGIMHTLEELGMVLQTRESILKLFSAYKSQGCLKASQGSRARLTLGIVDICLLCRILAKQKLGIEFHWLQSHHFNAVHGEMLKHHLLFADILSSIVKRILSRRDSMPQSHREKENKAGSEASSINVSCWS